jgi:FkbM family methyltransferase
MIVIDLGAARYGGDYSIEHLIERFHPEILYAFDPNENFSTHVEKINETLVICDQRAAWTTDGEIPYLNDGLNSQTRPQCTHWERATCFDLATFIRGFDPAYEIVLKMDVEGAEYFLLPHLIWHEIDKRLSLLLVEWHHREATTQTLRIDS